jgi:hypothetical protein
MLTILYFVLLVTFSDGYKEVAPHSFSKLEDCEYAKDDLYQRYKQEVKEAECVRSSCEYGFYTNRAECHSDNG